MRVLGVRSTLAASVGTAAPAAPASGTVRVFATCAPAGRVVIRQTARRSAGTDSTHVVVRGRRLILVAEDARGRVRRVAYSTPDPAR